MALHRPGDPMPDGAELVNLGGTEYLRRPCGPCQRSGRSYDPTLADNVHAANRGTIPCPACRGEGHTLTITSAGLAAETARHDARRAAAPEAG